MIAHEKFKKNAILLYSLQSENNSSFQVKYKKTKVSFECQEDSAPVELISEQFDLKHPVSKYSIPHVGKAIYELQQGVESEIAARESHDSTLGDDITTLGTALAAEQVRAIEEEVRLDGALKAEQTRARAVEDNIIDTVASNKADADDKRQQMQSKLQEETQQRKNADKNITDDIAAFKTENAAEHDELRTGIEDEKERAINREQEIHAELDALKDMTNESIGAVEDELEVLISATNADTLARMDDLLDRLENADNDISKAIQDALEVADENQKKYRAIVYDLSSRIAYLEGVVIETFNQDRRYDNFAALVVVADILGTGDGSQSGYYKQFRKGCYINQEGLFEESSRHVFIRADFKYSIIFDARTSEWVFTYSNAILNIGKHADRFSATGFGAGTNPDAPTTNEAMGVYIEMKGALSNTSEDGTLPGSDDVSEEE